MNKHNDRRQRQTAISNIKRRTAGMHKTIQHFSLKKLVEMRTELLALAEKKDIIYFKQYDACPPHSEYTAVLSGVDHDKPIVYCIDTYDLALFDEVRVRIPMGYRRDEAIEMLKAVIGILEADTSEHISEEPKPIRHPAISDDVEQWI
jgi:hypothetical protein